MNRNEAKLVSLDLLEEMVRDDIEKVGPVMDDYDGGQVAAYEKVLEDIKLYRSIIGCSMAHLDSST